MVKRKLKSAQDTLIDPVPVRCSPPENIIPGVGFLTRELTIFGDFNEGIPAQVEFGWGGGCDDFDKDYNVFMIAETSPAKIDRLVIMILIPSNADENGRYIKVTQEDHCGVSEEEIFTLVKR